MRRVLWFFPIILVLVLAAFSGAPGPPAIGPPLEQAALLAPAVLAAPADMKMTNLAGIHIVATLTNGGLLTYSNRTELAPREYVAPERGKEVAATRAYTRPRAGHPSYLSGDQAIDGPAQAATHNPEGHLRT